jgi:hypothetical protein
MSVDVNSIENHSGKKYLRKIYGAVSATQPQETGCANVDVYAVLEAYEVRCQALGHVIKKLLCAGIRGKGDTVKDLKEARDALSRAIELAEQRAALVIPPGPSQVFTPGPPRNL